MLLGRRRSISGEFGQSRRCGALSASAGIPAVRPIVPELTFFTHVLIALLALTAIRIVGQHFSVVDLFFDEAQY